MVQLVVAVTKQSQSIFFFGENQKILYKINFSYLNENVLAITRSNF